MFLGIVSALTLSASAHRLDECLVATRVDIASNAVILEIDLQPGVAVLAEFMSWVDENEDAAISQLEATKFAQSLMRSTQVRFDDATLELNLVSVEIPSIESLEQGQGRLKVVAKTEIAPNFGTHELHYRCAFRPDTCVYLVNAYLPEDPLISLGKQKRDHFQRVYEVSFAKLALESASNDKNAQHFRSGASLIKAVIQLSRTSLKALTVLSRESN